MTIPFPQLAAVRLGYGLSPLMPPPADAAAVLADVPATAALPALHTTEGATQVLLRRAELADARRESGDPDGPEAQALQDFTHAQVLAKVQFLRRRLAACAGAPVGFGERLVQFWADHFTAAPRGAERAPLAFAFVEEAIRPHIGGSFADLFTAAETHPAMLLYLDQTRSVGDRSVAALRSKGRIGLNENLAREMLELHSLGVGAGYTQQDVRQLANLLTGLTYDPRKPGETFIQRYVQPGAETVLGRSYGGTRRDGMEAILAAFRDLAARPETARYVSRKLAVHFVADEPDKGLVDDLTAAWGHEGDLPAVYAVLVDHPQLRAQARAKVRQPFDWLAASLRALGLDADAIEALPDDKAKRWMNAAMVRMGQTWLEPVGPDGWAERGSDWINPQLLAERIDWAMNAPRALLEALPDSRRFLQAALGDTASEVLARAVPRAESQRDGVGIVLASNDFNRR